MDSPTPTPVPMVAPVPSRDELNAELLPVPEPPDQPAETQPPGFDEVLDATLRHIKGKRGGDLVAAILVGSAARHMMTAHSDVDMIAVVKGEEEREELVRVGDRTVEILYRGQRLIEEDLRSSLRLTPLLRKARVLFELEGAGGRLVGAAQDRFRQGPPRPSLWEQIRLRSECEHWLGKAEDLQRKPATALFLLGLFFDQYLSAAYRLRGLWPTAPVDMIRFLASRDQALGSLIEQFQLAPTVADKLRFGRQLTDLLVKDVPHPARID